VLALPGRAAAQQQAQGVVAVSASFGERVKLSFDRTVVALDTDAYDPDTVVPIRAEPLIITAKARVVGNRRLLLTAQANGPLTSGTDTIPLNKLTWTAAGDGFFKNGMAQQNAPRHVGQWRGSGTWVGSQVYEFEDSWDYAVGVYTVVMIYTLSMP
jgi:hypothetical protein